MKYKKIKKRNERGGRVMTAEEMFKELGYKKVARESCISYIKAKDRHNLLDKYIQFRFRSKELSVSRIDDTFSIVISDKICKEEDKAIRKQLEELKWL